MDVFKNKIKELGTLTLTLICLSAVFNLRNLPLLAQYGIESLLLYPLMAFLFLIPCAFICAELSSGWPNAGGMYIWIKEAFGPKVGFLAVWLDWIINLIWFPTILSFIVGMLTFLINPSLAQNKWVMCGIMLSFLWSTTLINFLGINFSARLSGYTTLIGSFLPCLFLIVIGGIYFLNHTTESINQITHLSTHPSNHYEYICGLILSFAGLEVGGLISRSKNDLRHHYPRALFLATIAIISITLLGTLAINCILAPSELSLLSGFIQTFQKYSSILHCSWLTTVIVLLSIIGSLSVLNTWVGAPVRSLSIIAQDNHLSKLFKYQNTKNAPTKLLLLQAFISSIIISLFLWMPTITDYYWLLLDLTAQLTLIMYTLLFLSFIRLRQTQPNVIRPYSVPGGKTGVFILASTGIFTCLVAIIMGFIPSEKNRILYELFLITGLLLSLTLPILFIKLKNNTYSEKMTGDLNEHY